MPMMYTLNISIGLYILLNVSLEPVHERLVIHSRPDLVIMNLKEKYVEIGYQGE